MDGKTIARIGAVAFVALAIVATTIEMNRHDDPQGAASTEVRPARERDPLDAELARCSGSGEAGARDPSCLKAWGQARRRFLGQPSAATPAAPSSSAPATLFPNAPPAEPAQSAAQPEPSQALAPSSEGGR